MGTSTDISAIKNGRVMVQYAEVGGHKTYLHSLDTRTIGVAGGSMVRLNNGKIAGVGSAQRPYCRIPLCSFLPIPVALSQGGHLIKIQPLADDPTDYLVLEAPDGKRYAITNTCAANLTGDIKSGDYAYGNLEACKIAFTLLGHELGVSPEEAATQVLQVAIQNVIKVVQGLVEEYKLDPHSVTLVGGGGGAGAIVPFTAKMMGFLHAKVPKSEVISAVGVALAMVRETIERNLINPSQEDILRLRKEVELSALRLGAAPDTIEVFVEVDAARQIVRATATGATELQESQSIRNEVSIEKRHEIAAASMNVPVADVQLIASTSVLDVFSGIIFERRFFGFFKKKITLVRVVNQNGVVRLQVSNPQIVSVTADLALIRLQQLIDETIAYEDGGKQMPGVFLLYQARILDLSGMNDSQQVMTVSKAELAGIAGDEKVVLISIPKN